jgi:hypothetical protein
VSGRVGDRGVVLPRLSGNRAKLERPLAKLCAYLRDLAQPEEDVRFLYALFSQLFFSIIFPTCQFWIFLKVDVFQSTFVVEPIKNHWRAGVLLTFRVGGQFETKTDRQRRGKWIRFKIAKRFRLFGDENGAINAAL